MTRRRRLLLFAVAALLLLLGAVAWLICPSEPDTAITVENAKRIQLGMALTEVETILGGPKRNDATGPLEMIWEDLWDTPVPVRVSESHVWQSDSALVQVYFDENHRVIYIQATPGYRLTPIRPLNVFRRWRLRL
jgi:hypothetical protein